MHTSVHIIVSVASPWQCNIEEDALLQVRPSTKECSLGFRFLEMYLEDNCGFAYGHLGQCC